MTALAPIIIVAVASFAAGALFQWALSRNRIRELEAYVDRLDAAAVEALWRTPMVFDPENIVRRGGGL
jgi:hypothetical protein